MGEAEGNENDAYEHGGRPVPRAQNRLWLGVLRSTLAALMIKMIDDFADSV